MKQTPAGTTDEGLASFSIRISRELLADLQELAGEHARSMNGEMVWALQAYVQNIRKAKKAMNANSTLQSGRWRMFDNWVATNPVVAYSTPEPDSRWVCIDCAASGTVGVHLTPVGLIETNLASEMRLNLVGNDTCSICGLDAFVDRRANERPTEEGK